MEGREMRRILIVQAKGFAMKKFLTLLFAICLMSIAHSAQAAGALSAYADGVWMNHIFGTAYTPVSTVYLALSTSASLTNAATGASMSEVANSNGYAREAITFGAASARAITQNATVTFPQASGSWGTVQGWCIVDSGTYGSGNVLAFGQFTASFSPVSGNIASIASGQVVVSVNSSSNSRGWTTYLADKMLGLMFADTAYSQPATYVVIENTAATDASTTCTGEVTGTGYSRTLVNKVGGSSPAWGTISSGDSSNANAISWSCGSAWTQINGVAICDASSSGNTLMYDSNTTDVPQQTPPSGDTVQFATSALAVSMQ
jgi:hypothetical protein